MNFIVIGIVFYLMIRSVLHFITYREVRSHNKTAQSASISLEVFYTLIIIYLTVTIGFGMIYFLLSFYDVTLVESGNNEQTIIELIFRSFYFSDVTLLTIGYGDITPVGIGRIVAIVQALIGYILPTAFVLKLVHMNFELKRSR